MRKLASRDSERVELVVGRAAAAVARRTAPASRRSTRPRNVRKYGPIADSANAWTDARMPLRTTNVPKMLRKNATMISSDVPGLEHAAALLHLDAVDERGAHQPRHQRHVLDGVPAPVAAPAQHVVGPPGAQDVAQPENHPRHHRVAARQGDPLVAQLARRQRGDRERERHAPAHQARQQHRRVDAHALVVQQRVQPDAVGGWPRQRLERRGDEAEQQRHERLR